MASVAADQPAAATEDCNWRKLGPGLLHNIASFLPAAEVAISLKLLDKETAAALRDFRVVAIARQPPSWMTEGFGVDGKSTARLEASRWFCLALPGGILRLVAKLEWSRDDFWRRLNLRQRRQMLCAAASSGDFGALRAALQHCGCSLTSAVLAAAAAAGNCHICRFLAFQNGCPWEACISWAAAGHGHLEALQWAQKMEKECKMASRGIVPQPSDLLEAACGGGHPEAVDRLAEAWDEYQQSNYDPFTTPGDAERIATGKLWAVLQGYGDSSGGDGSSARGSSLGGAGGAASGIEGRGRGGAGGGAGGGARSAAAAAVARRDLVLERCMMPEDLPMSAHDRHNVLCLLATNCPLALLQRYYDPLITAPDPWRDLLNSGGSEDGDEDEDKGVASSDWARQQLLISAVASLTPDWEQKADWLLRDKWGVVAAESLAQLLSRELPRGNGVTLWPTVIGAPDCLQRLPRLAERGVSMRAREDVRAAVCTAAGAGRLKVLQHLLDVVCPQLQLAVADVVTEDAVDSAVRGGYLPVLNLLRERAGAGFTQRQLRAVAQAGQVEVVRWLAMTPCAVAPAAAPAAAAAAGGGGDDAGADRGDAGGSSRSPAAAAGDDEAPWPWVFSRVAEAGCDVALLRLLHEERGAAIDLMAVARGGSVEQLAWAVATLRAAGRPPQALTAAQLWEVACEWGNTATADWLLSESLAVLPDANFVCGQLREGRSLAVCPGASWWLAVMDERAERAGRDGSGCAFFAALRSHRARVVKAAEAAVKQGISNELLPYQFEYLSNSRYGAARAWLYDVRQRRRRGLGELDAAEAEAQDAWAGMAHGKRGREWGTQQPEMSSALSSSEASDEEDQGEDEDEGEAEGEGEDEGEDEDDGEDEQAEGGV
ncbi:hypothetical protein HXX76_005990 [Chlamydomonas incerta]|uniref:Uncharacterized protein n=1 Tax=Chlamydomonas incerta TaxID=51695 RepID=A0A835T1Z3_CHLIN|nr:hypothetical protein HXX76_005990 [Chlamydomonas incerta]|eukprot:KAG2437333.1 hypothetical protein HXX76_005990 [Chlamydomonas incerta]